MKGLENAKVEKPDHDEINGDDIIQYSGEDEDQHPGQKCDYGTDVSRTEGHDTSPLFAGLAASKFDITNSAESQFRRKAGR
jgi:hypothetical protein